MKRLSTRLISLALAIVSTIAIAGLSSTTVELEPHGVDPLRRVAYKQKMAKVKERNALIANRSLAVPRVALQKKHFDFGLLDPGTSAFHDFLIENVGEGPLTIEVGETTCKCTIGKVEEPILLPGEKTNIRLEWNTGHAAEHFEQTAWVRTNDPAFPKLQLSVAGSIKSVLAFHPHQFFFGSVDPGIQAESSVYLYSQLWSDFSIVSVKLDNIPAEFDVTSIAPQDAPASTLGFRPRSIAKLAVRHRSTSRGRFQGECEVEVMGSDGVVRVETLNYQGKTRSPITFHSPEVIAGEGLHFGTINRGVRVEKRLIVRVRGEDPQPIEIIDVQPAVLETSLENLGPGEYRLTLSIPADCEPMVFNRDDRRGYVELGSPNNDAISNWLPVWVAVADVN